MEPIYFLWMILAITALAAATNVVIDFRRAVALRRLAARWNMQFVLDDRFRLAQRIERRLPVAGAANVRARNLMYRSDDLRRRYLFTVEFGVGAIGGHRRRRCVASLDEPCSDSAGPGCEPIFTMGPAELPLIAQYEKLHEMNQP